MSIDQWLDKEDVKHIKNGILVIKKNEIFTFVTTWIDPKVIRLREIRQGKTKMWFHLYVESKKQNKLMNRTEINSQIQETNCWLSECGGTEGVDKISEGE